ncbi:MAG: leucine-rich repeat domain-containing protein [Bacteroides sp.]|nr:leucine-rich repeat domain-containing protein [Bacteroides sp.]
MRKAVFCLLLPIVLLLGGCGSGEAEEFSENTLAAAYDENGGGAADFEYFFKAGDYDRRTVCIVRYTGGERIVVIPDEIEGCPVTSVDAYFLKGCDAEEVIFPSNMTVFNGLEGCETLRAVRFPASLEKMGGTLRFCTGLTEIEVKDGGTFKTAEGVMYTADGKTLISFPRGRSGTFAVPEGVECISEYAFFGSSLSDIILPSSLKAVEQNAFMSSNAFEELIIPSSVKKIGSRAFYECNIKKLTLAEGIEEIGGEAFSKNPIEELYIPASVKKIEAAAFSECNIKNLTLSEGIEEIGGEAFSKNPIEELNVPASVKKIEYRAFSECNIKNLTLSEGIEEIGIVAFSKNSIEELNVPASVKKIEYRAFSECNIKNLTLSEGIEEIGNEAFSKNPIEELYIPDSAASCGVDAADESVRISAAYPTEGLKVLAKRKNTVFRNETALEAAFRSAEELVDRITNNYSYCQLIVTDITGDNFPEMISLYGNRAIDVYFFFKEANEWQRLTGNTIDIAYEASALKLYLVYDKENGSRSYYSDIVGYKGFAAHGIEDGDFIPSQFKAALTERGLEQTELFWEETADPSSMEISDVIDISGILSGIETEYGLDYADTYKKFVLITDRFAEEPFGKPSEKPVTLNETTYDSFPYLENAYPEDFKITVAGKDILHGGETESVYFKQGMLVLDNAVIDAGDEGFVITASREKDFVYELDIKLIGENRVISEKPCSLFDTGRASIHFYGDGSLEAPKISARTLYLFDGASLRENKALVFGEVGVNVRSLELYGSSYLEYEAVNVYEMALHDDSRAELKRLLCDTLVLDGSSTARLINDLPDMSADAKASAIQNARAISVEDNARLYADNSLQKYDTVCFYGKGSNINVEGNGYFEIKGNEYSAGAAEVDWINIAGSGTLTADGAETCLSAARVDIFGGSLKLTACGGGKAAEITGGEQAREYGGFYVFGEVLEESPAACEILPEIWNGVLYSEGETAGYYYVRVKENEP